jgi:hypothetical protein
MLFRTKAVQSAEIQHALNMDRIEGFRREEANILAGVIDPSDFDGRVARDDALTAVRRKIVMAAGVARSSADLLEKAEAEARAREDDATHKAAEKLAVAQAKLVVEIAAGSEKLAADFARLEEMATTIEEANKVRGDRPYIVDGERKVRERPGGFLPAITGQDSVGVDKDGNRVPEFITEEGGVKSVRNPKWFRNVEVLNTIRAEQHLPPIMPEPFTTAIHLVDLHGRLIWPAHQPRPVL